MAVKTKKVQPKETPSQRFERVAEKVLARQRRADQRRTTRGPKATANTTQ